MENKLIIKIKQIKPAANVHDKKEINIKMRGMKNI